MRFGEVFASFVRVPLNATSGYESLHMGEKKEASTSPHHSYNCSSIRPSNLLLTTNETSALHLPLFDELSRTTLDLKRHLIALLYDESSKAITHVRTKAPARLYAASWPYMVALQDFDASLSPSSSSTTTSAGLNDSHDKLPSGKRLDFQPEMLELIYFESKTESCRYMLPLNFKRGRTRFMIVTEAGAFLLTQRKIYWAAFSAILLSTSLTRATTLLWSDPQSLLPDGFQPLYDPKYCQVSGSTLIIANTNRLRILTWDLARVLSPSGRPMLSEPTYAAASLEHAVLRVDCCFHKDHLISDIRVSPSGNLVIIQTQASIFYCHIPPPTLPPSSDPSSKPSPTIQPIEFLNLFDPPHAQCGDNVFDSSHWQLSLILHVDDSSIIVGSVRYLVSFSLDPRTGRLERDLKMPPLNLTSNVAFLAPNSEFVSMIGIRSVIPMHITVNDKGGVAVWDLSLPDAEEALLAHAQLPLGPLLDAFWNETTGEIHFVVLHKERVLHKWLTLPHLLAKHRADSSTFNTARVEWKDALTSPILYEGALMIKEEAGGYEERWVRLRPFVLFVYQSKYSTSNLGVYLLDPHIRLFRDGSSTRFTLANGRSRHDFMAPSSIEADRIVHALLYQLSSTQSLASIWTIPFLDAISHTPIQTSSSASLSGAAFHPSMNAHANSKSTRFGMLLSSQPVVLKDQPTTYPSTEFLMLTILEHPSIIPLIGLMPHVRRNRFEGRAAIHSPDTTSSSVLSPRHSDTGPFLLQAPATLIESGLSTGIDTSKPSKLVFPMQLMDLHQLIELLCDPGDMTASDSDSEVSGSSSHYFNTNDDDPGTEDGVTEGTLGAPGSSSIMELDLAELREMASTLGSLSASAGITHPGAGGTSTGTATAGSVSSPAHSNTPNPPNSVATSSMTRDSSTQSATASPQHPPTLTIPFRAVPLVTTVSTVDLAQGAVSINNVAPIHVSNATGMGISKNTLIGSQSSSSSPRRKSGERVGSAAHRGSPRGHGGHSAGYSSGGPRESGRSSSARPDTKPKRPKSVPADTIPWKTVLRILTGLASGIATLHRFEFNGRVVPIAHRDIKCENILISASSVADCVLHSRCTAMLADFEHAIFTLPFSSTPSRLAHFSDNPHLKPNTGANSANMPASGLGSTAGATSSGMSGAFGMGGSREDAVGDDRYHDPDENASFLAHDIYCFGLVAWQLMTLHRLAFAGKNAVAQMLDAGGLSDETTAMLQRWCAPKAFDRPSIDGVLTDLADLALHVVTYSLDYTPVIRASLPTTTSAGSADQPLSSSSSRNGSSPPAPSNSSVPITQYMRRLYVHERTHESLVNAFVRDFPSGKKVKVFYGAPGTGKTLLLDTAAELAEISNFVPICARAIRGKCASAYGVLMELAAELYNAKEYMPYLKHVSVLEETRMLNMVKNRREQELATGIPTAPPPGFSWSVLRSLFVRAVQSGRCSLLLIIDDLQHVDAASLACIADLLQEPFCFALVSAAPGTPLRDLTPYIAFKPSPWEVIAGENALATSNATSPTTPGRSNSGSKRQSSSGSNPASPHERSGSTIVHQILKGQFTRWFPEDDSIGRLTSGRPLLKSLERIITLSNHRHMRRLSNNSDSSASSASSFVHTYSTRPPIMPNSPGPNSGNDAYLHRSSGFKSISSMSMNEEDLGEMLELPYFGVEVIQKIVLDRARQDRLVVSVSSTRWRALAEHILVYTIGVPAFVMRYLSDIPDIKTFVDSYVVRRETLNPAQQPKYALPSDHKTVWNMLSIPFRHKLIVASYLDFEWTEDELLALSKRILPLLPIEDVENALPGDWANFPEARDVFVKREKNGRFRFASEDKQRFVRNQISPTTQVTKFRRSAIDALRQMPQTEMYHYQQMIWELETGMKPPTGDESDFQHVNALLTASAIASGTEVQKKLLSHMSAFLLSPVPLKSIMEINPDLVITLCLELERADLISYALSLLEVQIPGLELDDSVEVELLMLRLRLLMKSSEGNRYRTASQLLLTYLSRKMPSLMAHARSRSTSNKPSNVIRSPKRDVDESSEDPSHSQSQSQSGTASSSAPRSPSPPSSQTSAPTSPRSGQKESTRTSPNRKRPKLATRFDTAAVKSALAENVYPHEILQAYECLQRITNAFVDEQSGLAKPPSGPGSSPTPAEYTMIDEMPALVEQVAYWLYPQVANPASTFTQQRPDLEPRKASSPVLWPIPTKPSMNSLLSSPHVTPRSPGMDKSKIHSSAYSSSKPHPNYHLRWTYGPIEQDRRFAPHPIIERVREMLETVLYLSQPGAHDYDAAPLEPLVALYLYLTYAFGNTLCHYLTVNMAAAMVRYPICSLQLFQLSWGLFTEWPTSFVKPNLCLPFSTLYPSDPDGDAGAIKVRAILTLCQDFLYRFETHAALREYLEIARTLASTNPSEELLAEVQLVRCQFALFLGPSADECAREVPLEALEGKRATKHAPLLQTFYLCSQALIEPERAPNLAPVLSSRRRRFAAILDNTELPDIDVPVVFERSDLIHEEVMDYLAHAHTCLLLGDAVRAFKNLRRAFKFALFKRSKCHGSSSSSAYAKASSLSPTTSRAPVSPQQSITPKTPPSSRRQTTVLQAVQIATMSPSHSPEQAPLTDSSLTASSTSTGGQSMSSLVSNSALQNGFFLQAPSSTGRAHTASFSLIYVSALVSYASTLELLRSASKAKRERLRKTVDANAHFLITRCSLSPKTFEHPSAPSFSRIFGSLLLHSCGLLPTSLRLLETLRLSVKTLLSHSKLTSENAPIFTNPQLPAFLYHYNASVAAILPHCIEGMSRSTVKPLAAFFGELGVKLGFLSSTHHVSQFVLLVSSTYDCYADMKCYSRLRSLAESPSFAPYLTTISGSALTSRIKRDLSASDYVRMFLDVIAKNPEKCTAVTSLLRDALDIVELRPILSLPEILGGGSPANVVYGLAGLQEVAQLFHDRLDYEVILRPELALRAAIPRVLFVQFIVWSILAFDHVNRTSDEIFSPLQMRMVIGFLETRSNTNGTTSETEDDVRTVYDDGQSVSWASQSVPETLGLTWDPRIIGRGEEGWPETMDMLLTSSPSTSSSSSRSAQNDPNNGQGNGSGVNGNGVMFGNFGATGPVPAALAHFLRPLMPHIQAIAPVFSYYEERDPLTHETYRSMKVKWSVLKPLKLADPRSFIIVYDHEKKGALSQSLIQKYGHDIHIHLLRSMDLLWASSREASHILIHETCWHESYTSLLEVHQSRHPRTTYVFVSERASTTSKPLFHITSFRQNVTTDIEAFHAQPTAPLLLPTEERSK